MGANNFLDGGDADAPGFLRLGGLGDNPGPHCMELFEHGGQRYFRLTTGANNPGGGGIVITCPLSRDQASRIAQAAQDLANRIID